MATDGPVYAKVVSNIERSGRAAPTSSPWRREGNDAIDEIADASSAVPRCDALWRPMVAIVPLQLLAYHIACRAA